MRQKWFSRPWPPPERPASSGPQGRTLAIPLCPLPPPPLHPILEAGCPCRGTVGYFQAQKHKVATELKTFSCILEVSASHKHNTEWVTTAERAARGRCYQRAVLGGRGCLNFSACRALLFAMLGQRSKETEVQGGSESGNLYLSAGGSVTQSARCSLLPAALEEVIRLCNPQDSLLHILILLILPGEGCLC